ncbi:flagellar protein [Acetohalobium arabaticum]|uniref:Flagellar protein n=1 Tax=Acetohalobium arabaticum (strain ATCC 49924 / DSM 5501 / Z-7288) TaxID=574087 RepID=D9QTN0_ACEAZ|nr:flagellar protein [Acetohalobium arabaticum]ADL11794.1 flagellar protein [Acetohalobium arabaticum DSM 5501]
MGLKNCERCGQVFASDRKEICRDCEQEVEENFGKVRDYIYDHGQATIPEVHEETGVSVKEIKQFIREGRLVEYDMDISVECKRCGTDIKSGDYCSDCREELSQGLASKKKKIKQDLEGETKTGKMHTRRRRDK